MSKPKLNVNPILEYYVITLLGYSKINSDGNRHTNWFPWNRFTPLKI